MRVWQGNPLAGMIVVVLGASQAGAAVTVTPTGETGVGPFTPSFTTSATDLINGASPSTSAGNFALEGSGGVSSLTNGTFGTISGGNPGTNALFATAGGGAGTGTELIYSLNTALNTQGYNLSSIAVYGGWNDSGRDQQKYAVSYSTVAAPTTFLPLTSVDFNPTAGANPSASRVVIAENALPNLASNVAAVRFLFDPTSENGYSGYTEIDVIGTAAPIPEPASLYVLTAAAAFALGRRRRRD